MTKKVLLVGHCGADSSYLRLAVKKAAPEVHIENAEDTQSLTAALESKTIDLVLFNRELDYGFDSIEGVEVIRSLQPAYAKVPMILVSNYPEAQQAAVAAGALPGFGKRELGSPRVTALLRDALGVAITS
jgi:two-component system, chemotaxis family, chemotaxis protein CheY